VAGVHNALRQKFCKRPKCVRDRKRIRQRKSYNQRYELDEQFRKKEQERARQGQARRRAAERLESNKTLAVDQHVLLGMVQALSGTTNQQQVARDIRSYAREGRQLERRLRLATEYT